MPLIYAPKRVDNHDPARCGCGCGRRLADWDVAEVIVPTRYVEVGGRYEVADHRTYLVRNDTACIRNLLADTRDWHEAAIEDDLVTGGVSLTNYAVHKTA